MEGDDRRAPVTPLDWDSEFLGLSVTRLDEPILAIPELAHILGKLRAEGVNLVYWPSAAELDPGAMQQLGGALVDTKTTFVADLRGLRMSELPHKDAERFSATTAGAELEELAIQAGAFSRFARDPRIPRERFEALYRLWIRGAVAGELARGVLLVREEDRVAGVVTVGERNGRGEIGLLAVGAAFRGRGVGRTLVQSAKRWSASEGHSFGQVVTQGGNVAACALYASCGYAVERVEYYYHLWL